MLNLERFHDDAFCMEIFKRKLPWIFIDVASGKLIIVVDNHLMTTHRACADNFMMAHVEGKFLKGLPEQPSRSWYLEFGIIFHILIEHYYKHFRDPDFSVAEWAGDMAYKVWTLKNMDAFAGVHPEHHAIGGLMGFQAMLLAYAHKFKPENEKLRIIGTEVSFGKNREIPLYIGEYVEVYLAGRMDVIVDDGYFIMPMDHKTCGSFKRGDPLERYLIDEGPTGYIYTLRSLLPKLVPEELRLKRGCNKILMNFIEKQFNKDNPLDRFKRLPMFKSDEQLDTYRMRMLLSVEQLLCNLESHFQNLPVPRNTQACTDWYHGKCPYYDVHRQATKDGEQNTLQNGLVTLPIWDTETINALNS